MGVQISLLVPIAGHGTAFATLGTTREFIMLAATLEFLPQDGSRNVRVGGEVKLFVQVRRRRDGGGRWLWINSQRLIEIFCKIGAGALQKTPLVKLRSQGEVDVEGKEVEAHDRLSSAELLRVQKRQRGNVTCGRWNGKIEYTGFTPAGMPRINSNLRTGGAEHDRLRAHAPYLIGL